MSAAADIDGKTLTIIYFLLLKKEEEVIGRTSTGLPINWGGTRLTHLILHMIVFCFIKQKSRN